MRSTGPGVDAAAPVTECPYRGLLAFEAGGPRASSSAARRWSPIFVGRLAPGRLLAVVGASGSGKSSVLRAGLAAAVDAGEVDGARRAVGC